MINFETISLIALFYITFSLGKVFSKSILHPIRLFSLCWMCFVLVSRLFWHTGYEWSGGSSFWIVAAVLFMELGGLMTNRIYKGKFIKDVGNNHRIENLGTVVYMGLAWKVLLGIIVLGLLGVALQVTTSGFSIADFSSFQSLLDVNAAFAAQRYSGTMQNSTSAQILLTFVYLCGICGGYSYNYAKTKFQRGLSFATLMPITLLMLFSNGKAGFIAEVILWFAGWTVSYIKLHGALPTVKRKLLVSITIGFLSFLLILYLVMLLRVGDFSASMRARIADKFWGYALGQMVSFDAWFSNGDDFNLYEFGKNTYMAIFKILGLAVRKQGVYEVYIQGYGNVYTVFRGVITDFGVFFGLIYCGLRGAVTQAVYLKLAGGTRRLVWPALLLICNYFWSLYGFIISPWIYTSYCLAILGFGIYLLLFHRRIRDGKLRI